MSQCNDLYAWDTYAEALDKLRSPDGAFTMRDIFPCRWKLPRDGYAPMHTPRVVFPPGTVPKLVVIISINVRIWDDEQEREKHGIIATRLEPFDSAIEDTGTTFGWSIVAKCTSPLKKCDKCKNAWYLWSFVDAFGKRVCYPCAQNILAASRFTSHNTNHYDDPELQRKMMVWYEDIWTMRSPTRSPLVTGDIK
jgi:hypothetical protein